jgi:ABC-type multidrug transport system fused ATPase/permease subunit
LLVLIGLPLLSLVILPLLRPLEKRESIQREAAGQASAIAADTIGGLRVLRGIGGEQLFVARYHNASQEVRRAAVSTARVRSILDALQVLLPGIFVVLVTWLGARLALDGQISVGELVAFYGYTAFLVLPLRTITEAADKFTRGRVAARRVVSLMTIQRDESAQAAAKRVDNPNLDSLPHALALTDTSNGITVPAGTLVAIVCADPSSAGDLASRLAGYGEQASGVSIHDIAIEEFSLDDLRRTIVLQDKDPVILSGTLSELLAVPGSDLGFLSAATHAACADDVIESLGGDPNDAERGYTAVVPERGRTLSGGQRQRLSLDRSLMSRAPILILDEPTSAVDAHTEARIAAGLREFRTGQTTVVFTTSPLVLDQCDHVLFAPESVVVAQGHHHDLLRTNAQYRAVVIRGDD